MATKINHYVMFYKYHRPPVWWYACYYIRVDFMYVGMHGLGMSLADCSGRRVHKIDPYMVTYYDCIRVDFMYMGVAWVRPCSGRRVDKIDPLYGGMHATI